MRFGFMCRMHLPKKIIHSSFFIIHYSLDEQVAALFVTASFPHGMNDEE